MEHALRVKDSGSRAPLPKGGKGIGIAARVDQVYNWILSYLKKMDPSDHRIVRASDKEDLFSLAGQKGVELLFIEIGFFYDALLGNLGLLEKQYPHVRVVLFSVSYIHEEEVSRILWWGGDSFINLSGSEEEIKRSIRYVLNGGSCLPDGILAAMERYGRKLSGPPELTEKEAEIARLLVREYPRKAIGPNLMMSEKTVGNHIDNMHKKFGAHENIGILRGLMSRELIAPDDLKRRYWIDKGAVGAGDGWGKTPLRLAPSKGRGAYADLERAE